MEKEPEVQKDIPTVQVQPEAKKTVEKTLKKLQKVIDTLKGDGWVTADDEIFWHPLCKDDQAVRERLDKLDLLITRKCRITIHTLPTTQIQIA